MRPSLLGIVTLALFATPLTGQSVSPEREIAYASYLEIGAFARRGEFEPEWLSDGTRFRFTVAAGGEPPATYVYDPRTRTRQLDTAPETVSSEPRQVGRGPFGFPLMEILSPDGRWFAHRRDNDLWLRAPGSEELVRLTGDGVNGAFWGEALEWDEQYGRPWAWWSPDGSRLAVKKLDERDVPLVARIRYGEGQPVVEEMRFAAPGDPLPKRELAIFDVSAGSRVRVEDERDPEQQIMALGWSPDGSEFRYLTMDRAHKLLRLVAADASTGDARVLVEERTERFHNPLWSSPPDFIPLQGGELFLWTSDRDGWRHIYLYDMAGTPVRQVTSGSFPIHEILHVDERGGWVYFTAHPDSRRPYDLHLARVRLDGSGFERLTSAPGRHRIRFAPSGEFFVDTHSSVNRPPVTVVRRSDGSLVDTLAQTDPLELTDLLGEVGWTPPEEIVVPTADGRTELHGLLYKPFDFDPSRRYPVIEYVYDAPYTTVVSRTFPGVGSSDPSESFPLDSVDPLALAQFGYLVWVVDGRGTAERGRAFRQAFLEDGFDAVQDHANALRKVARERPYVDLERVGIFGVSAGGSQTLAAMLRAPDFYRVGVAISAPVDPRGTAADGIEFMHGPVDQNPGAYESEILRSAERLRGKLLLIYGTDDPVVPMNHALRMVDALVEAGRPHDLLLLPGQEHLFSGDGARYARTAVRRYFLEHLPPGR